MTRKEMEEFLINNNEEAYYETVVPFSFNGKRYQTTINFAYFNNEVDSILKKNGVKYDESWMMLKAFTKSNYNSYLDFIVRGLYKQNYDDQPQKVIMDILRLTNKMINFFNSNKKVSQDFSLLNVMIEATKNPKLEKLLFHNKISEDATPEQMMEHRQNSKDAFKQIYTPGVTELMQSGYGIKEDQMVNIFGGINLIPRIHNMHEMFPRPVATDWLWGIQNKDQFFMTANINAYALYMSKTIIQRSGVINKLSTMIAQDTTLTEHDCGTKTYVEYDIPDEKALKTLVYKYMVNPDGSLEEITPDHKHLIGKRVQVRSAYTCCAKNGQLCNTCFGANWRWNRSTDEYRRDLGVEFTKVLIIPISQDIISTKHNTAPILIPLSIRYREDVLGTKEKTLKNLEDNEFFTRKFNKFIWKPGIKVFLDKLDCENPIFESKKDKLERQKKGIMLSDEDVLTKPKEYLDNEFGENDIIRSSCLILEKDGKRYRLYPNSYFRISGFPMRELLLEKADSMIELDHNVNLVSHVIKNDAKALKFFVIEDLYKLTTQSINNKVKVKDNKESWDDDDGKIVADWREFVERVNAVFPDKPKILHEIAFRNKIRDANDPHKRPDWKSDNPEAVVLTLQKTIAARPSLSLKIAAGYIKQRLNDPFYHDPKNLMTTSYDRIYDDEKRKEDAEAEREKR